MGKLADALAHPDEIIPMLRIYAATKAATKLPSDPNLAFCYDMLNRVSRSFAIVIQQLPNPLRDAICVFYLVLRGLDTVEDDMALPAGTKLPALRAFHERIYERGFTMACGYGHYVRLMAQFDVVVDVFLGLGEGFQAVIADITRRMGAGMADFIEREVVTVADYDLYCHYVAGLVGVGLSQLFASSGLESPRYASPKVERLANGMGLFLQKTNIIRDYLEDINELPAPRMFWPRDIWGRYAPALADFREPANRAAAVRCLNHMVCDALRHVPECFAYMRGLQDRDVFRFCAIPQIMAAGTLALCYNNGAVFEGAVKLRRGLTARVFAECEGLGSLYGWFVEFLQQLRERALLAVPEDDPTRALVLERVEAALAECERGLAEARAAAPRRALAQQRALDAGLLVLAGCWFHRAWQLGAAAGGAGGGGGLLQGLLLRGAPLLYGSGAAGAAGGALLPAGYGGLEKALCLMLLLAAMSRVVLVRVA